MFLQCALDEDCLVMVVLLLVKLGLSAFSKGYTNFQLRHGLVNRKKITRPEEASRMRCNTVAIKNSKYQNKFINLLFDGTCMIDNII